MKTLYLYTSLLFLLLFSSCIEEKSTSPVMAISPQESSVQAKVTALMEATGLIPKIAEKSSWEEIHDNYLAMVVRFQDHEFLDHYKQTLIFYQVMKSNIFDDLTDERVPILKLYLNDLENFKKAYPMVSHKLINELQPYLSNAEIQQYSKRAYAKGKKQMEKAATKLERMLKSDNPEHFKEHFQQSYEKNYLTYLPKLKELSHLSE